MICGFFIAPPAFKTSETGIIVHTFTEKVGTDAAYKPPNVSNPFNISNS